jgi:hypothetical protein
MASAVHWCAAEHRLRITGIDNIYYNKVTKYCWNMFTNFIPHAT